ncbi:unnamed protein product [Cyclocybe aegerita]|uniref:non-specific serine/threonine protein kinase n=1 Tax=Cyclocybe aegerita TaxID=1973307 RepID=A0A8S0VZK0_CYCAE|nr:unnamed protein product [Cyclocybe aegerita]
MLSPSFPGLSVAFLSFTTLFEDRTNSSVWPRGKTEYGKDLFSYEDSDSTRTSAEDDWNDADLDENEEDDEEDSDSDSFFECNGESDDDTESTLATNGSSYLDALDALELDTTNIVDEKKSDSVVIEEYDYIVDSHTGGSELNDDDNTWQSDNEVDFSFSAYSPDELEVLEQYAPLLSPKDLPRDICHLSNPPSLPFHFPKPRLPLRAGSYGVIRYLVEREDITVSMVHARFDSEGKLVVKKEDREVYCAKTWKKISRNKADVEAELMAYRRISSGKIDAVPGIDFVLSLDAFLEDKDHFYFIMEPMRYSLRAVIRDRPTALNRVAHTRRLLSQIVLGVAALHAIGIIHRDIKPENVLIDCAGNVQIMDFNVSKVRQISKPYRPHGLYALATVGTLPYMAPEVRLQQTPYGIEIDYWAIGCIVYELESTYGEVLFNTRTIFNKWIDSIRQGFSRSKFLTNAGLKGSAVSLVEGLVRYDTRKRFGIRQLLFHPYFTVNGASTFQFALEEAERRARQGYNINIPRSYKKIFNPHDPRGSSQAWVNPCGALAS